VPRRPFLRSEDGQTTTGGVPSQPKDGAISRQQDGITQVETEVDELLVVGIGAAQVQLGGCRRMPNGTEVNPLSNPVRMLRIITSDKASLHDMLKFCFTVAADDPADVTGDDGFPQGLQIRVLKPPKRQDDIGVQDHP
jgi:hypothetical protein